MRLSSTIFFTSHVGGLADFDISQPAEFLASGTITNFDESLQPRSIFEEVRRMSFKFCSRCKFAVRKTSKLCAICGHDNFVTDAGDIRELVESPSYFAHLRHAAAAFSKELFDEAVETAEKTVRASRQMVALLRNQELESGEHSDNIG